MFRGKPFTVVLVVAVATALTVACGGAEGGDGSEVTELRFANIYDTSHPFNECGASTMTERAEDASEGNLIVNNFPGGQLGTEDELAESIVSQNLQMAIIGPAFLSQYDSRVGVLDAAYLFNGVEHMERVVDGEIGQELWSGLREESGMRVLGTWYYGTRHLTTGDTEVNSPEDLNGLKIRAPDVPIPIANVEALGASPTPIAFEEVYLALQQGTVDGQENPIATIAAQNFNEVQQYLMLTGHVVQSTQIVIADESWQTLSSEQQDTLQEAVDAAREEVRSCIESAEEENLNAWREAGQPQIIEDIDVEAFRQRAQEQLPEQFGDEWGDLYSRIQNAGS